MTLWLIYTSYINIYFWKPLQFSSPLSVYGPRDSLLTVLHALHPQIRKKAVSFISLAFICIQSSTPLQDGVYEITQAKHSRNSLCINPNADRSNLTTFSCHCVALTAYSGYRLFFFKHPLVLLHLKKHIANGTNKWNNFHSSLSLPYFIHPLGNETAPPTTLLFSARNKLMLRQLFIIWVTLMSS